MNVLMLLEMAASGAPGRVAVQDGRSWLTYDGLLAAAQACSAQLGDARHLVYVGTNQVAFPVALFAAAARGIPFVPLNYRLSDEQLRSLLDRLDGRFVVADAASRERLAACGEAALTTDEFVGAGAPAGDGLAPEPVDGDQVALLLYTSGTTSEPKAAILRHRHLASYVIGSVEFGAADERDAALVSVPPYHIAGVANLLSNLYLGRRVVYLEHFDPELWLATVRREGVTHAMVVPTMLARVCDALGETATAGVPTLRTLAYGGSRTPAPVLERALTLFAGVDFVNAYGLTETSSTIAVLGPEDHRTAFASEDAAVRARLSSAGRLLPGVEVEVRDDDGRPLPRGAVGNLFVRGEQVSGEYVGRPAALDGGGWFETRDRGWIDEDGYLFIEGRNDDTIIRGGENIAPAEIEDVLLAHPAIAECAVVGVPDDEWGQRIAAVVVPRAGADVSPGEVREWARARLRGSKTPDEIVTRTELPRTDTGKLLRRLVVASLVEPVGADAGG